MEPMIHVISPESASEELARPPQHPGYPSKQRKTSLLDWSIAVLLAVGAFIPRYVSAIKLDVSIDEPIYTIAGNIYISLIRNHDLTSPQWTYNYEHPAFAKLLMGLSVLIGKQWFHNQQQLLAARIPEVLMGTGMIVALYLLGRAPFGRGAALLAALCLLVSPWLIYFNAQALLDTTMTTLVTLTYLVLWHAQRRPALYLVLAILVGLSAASKYPSILALPGIFLYTAYYHFYLRRHLPTEQRAPLPWKWWLLAVGLAPLIFLLADPAIWADPLHRVIVSYQFSLNHAAVGHRTFWAGQIYSHEPAWMIFYILGGKLSAFVMLPAAAFLLGLAPYQLLRFHTGKRAKQQVDSWEIERIASVAFLFVWLGSGLAMFSRLTIIVGTHYFLPLAAPIALAAAAALTSLLGYRRGSLLITRDRFLPAWDARTRSGLLTLGRLTILVTVLVVPHLVGLLTIPELDGYTSEFLPGEDSTLQVGYNGYRDANQWLVAHTKTGGRVAVVGGSATVLWYIANSTRLGKLTFTVVNYGQMHDNTTYDYIVWPENLIQRNFLIPFSWRTRIVHVISGGNTTYCYILARDPSSLKTSG